MSCAGLLRLYSMRLSGVPIRGFFHQPRAAPHSDDPHSIFIQTVHDPKRRLDHLAQSRRVELRHHSTTFRKVRETLDPLDHPTNEAVTDVGDGLVRIPLTNRLQICDGGRGKGDAALPAHFRRDRAGA